MFSTYHLKTSLQTNTKQKYKLDLDGYSILHCQINMNLVFHISKDNSEIQTLGSTSKIFLIKITVDLFSSSLPLLSHQLTSLSHEANTTVVK